MKPFGCMKLSKLPLAAALAALACGTFALPAAGGTRDDLEQMPGYVAFGRLGAAGRFESTVDISLKGPLLRMAVEAVRDDEPGVATLLEKIKLVRIHVFELERRKAESLAESMRSLAKELERKSWKLAVRVREDGEEVHIFTLPGKQGDIDGLVVMVVDDEDAVFVNIVGNIEPADIGRLGRSLDIDLLEDLDIDIDTDSGTHHKHRRHRRGDDGE